MVCLWGVVSWSLLTRKGLNIQTEASSPEGKGPKWKSLIPCWYTTASAKTVLKRSTDSGMIPHFPISPWARPFQLLHSSCWNDTLIQGSACPNKEPNRRRGGSISKELPKVLSAWSRIQPSATLSPLSIFSLCITSETADLLSHHLSPDLTTTTVQHTERRISTTDKRTAEEESLKTNMLTNRPIAKLLQNGTWTCKLEKRENNLWSFMWIRF